MTDTAIAFEDTVTWNEFKAWVDKKIEKLGLDYSPHIFYIDVHMPTHTDLINMGIGYGEDGLAI